MKLRISLLVGIPLAAAAFSAQAVNDSQHLGAHGQSKVESAQAKGWMQSGGKKSGYDVQQSQSQVNIGSKRAGTCNMNVGGTQGRGNKDVVVTAKDIINVCK